MSQINVDTINEKTTGNGVNIPGHVLQVKRFETSEHVTVTTGSSWEDVYTALGSITPVSTDSKILAIANISCYVGGSDGNSRATLRFSRNGTGLDANTGYVGFTGSNPSAPMVNLGMTLLDTPSTTSSVNYGIQVNIGTSGTPGYQFSYDDANGEQISELVLMEIGG